MGTGHEPPFTNLSIDAGLSDKMVFAVAQDSTGLMWFGTAEGLNRYDGYNFETFRYNPGDSTSVSASFINCIHLTRTGELWIGTEKGLDLYDPVTESFVKYHADNDSLRLLNNLRIRCIHDDPQGVMWVGTLEGLIRLDLRKRYINYFVLVPDAFDRMANEIRSICADRHGMLWLGTFDGLYRFNPTDNSFVRYETRSRKLPNDTYNNLVNALYIPENTPDLLYVGSSSGLVVLDIRHPEQPLGTLRAEDGGLTDNDIKSILSYDDTHLLLATADGLTLYDTRSCQASAYYSSLSDPTSLPNNSLRTLFRDRQNIVWIGTDSGLAKLDLKRKKIDCVRLTNDRKGAERKVIVNDLLGPPTTACGSPRTKASCGTTARDATQDTRVTWPTKGFRTASPSGLSATATAPCGWEPTTGSTTTMPRATVSYAPSTRTRTSRSNTSTTSRRTPTTTS